MIRVRRVRTPLPLFRRYELDISDQRVQARGARLVRRLEEAVGIGDAWAFINAADRAYEDGSTWWAVEYEERSETPHAS
jgi:hypothetical protein